MADATNPADGGKPAADAQQAAADTMRSAADGWQQAGQRARDSFAEHVVDPARRAGEAMRASGQQVAQGGQALGLKMIEQAEQNTHEAFAAMREAAQARDIGEVMRIQGDYLRGQGQRAMDQAREIGDMIVRLGREAVAPLHPGDKQD